jgi:hypothetical protein
MISAPPDVVRLFWDVDPERVDLHLHRDYVMSRVMSRGGVGGHALASRELHARGDR